MPLRRRPPSSEASARLAALVGHRDPPVTRVGGWVPEQATSAVSPPAADHPTHRPPPTPSPPSIPLPSPTPSSPPTSGPVEGEGPVSVRAVLASGRLDPGRRGALALAAVGVVAALLAAVVVLRGRPSEQPLSVPAVAGSVQSSGGPELVVDVAGRVRRPGLVRLPAGARVDDALRAAGGVLPGAATGLLNLARKVSDGEQVQVGVDGAPAAGAASGGLLDLNLASEQDLDALPGFGPVLAERIVAWRTEHGRFASIDQLREVAGIGEAKYQSVKAKVRV